MKNLATMSGLIRFNDD